MVVTKQVNDGQLIAILVQNIDDHLGILIVAVAGTCGAASIMQRNMCGNKDRLSIFIADSLC